MTLQAKELEKVTLGGGCFWCIEAIFNQLKGVQNVTAGYAGGDKPNPTYEEVCSGLTKYAEVCQISYDPNKITFKNLLEVFFEIHDPTTVNRQGADVGTQYRSIVFYHNDKQKNIVESFIEELNKSNKFEALIVTEIAELSNFYKAEYYHQDYYNRNTGKPYCRMVISPKIRKFKRIFKDSLSK